MLIMHVQLKNKTLRSIVLVSFLLVEKYFTGRTLLQSSASPSYDKNGGTAHVQQ